MMRHGSLVAALALAWMAPGCTPEVRNFGTGGGGGGGSPTSSSQSSSSVTSSSSDSSTSSGGELHTAVLPAAPQDGQFFWQGVQRDFKSELDQPCVGKIAIAVGDQAVCYADPTGALLCAGSIYDQAFGPV